MRFQCSHCAGILAIDDCQPGEAVACGHCGSAVAVPATRVSTGAVIGDFVIREKLGEGGMGSVYLAHQISLDRAAALKILHPRYGGDAGYIQQFLREARAAAALNHPHIVQAYAVGDDDGLFYFAMEYVRGSTLKQVLMHGGRLVPERALQIAQQVASALDFAWQHQGLIHRDIKPDNIILTDDGTVKLADLGLARKMTDIASDGTQELYGTPQYISPEQLLGYAGDNRSDIYSFGATLYHALTGRFPFQGSDPGDIAQRHLSEALTPIKAVAPDVPASLALVVEIALAKRPWHRYSDIAAVLADLARVQHHEPPEQQSVPDAQDPIDPAGDEAAAIAEGTGGTDTPIPPSRRTPTVSRRVLVSPKALAGTARSTTGRVRTATAKTHAPAEAAADEGAEAAAAAADVDEIPEARQGGGRIVLLLGVVAIVAALVGAVLWRRSKGQDQGEDRQAGPTRTVPAEAAAALADIRAAVGAGAGDADVRSRLAAFMQQYGAEASDAADFMDLAAPYRESDLEKARTALFEAERKAWEERSAVLKAAAAADAERARLAAEGEAARRQEEEERRRQTAAEAQRQAQIAEERNALRWEAVELCRQQDYAAAKRLFVPMAVGRDPEARAWAEGKQLCLDLAGELLDSIVNTRDELAGTIVPVAGQRGEWKVTRVGFRDFDLESRRMVLNRGVRSEEVNAMAVTFVEMTPMQLDALTQRRWEQQGLDENRRALLFGAYLLARAQFLPEARKRLEASGRPEAAALLAELAAMEPELRRLEFERRLEQLRTMVGQGDLRRAQTLLELIRSTFPEEAEANTDRIKELLPGN